MKRRLWLLMLFLFAGHVPAASADSACEGRFVNPITDICWSCIFPLSLGSIKVSQGKVPDTANPSMPIQICPHRRRCSGVSGWPLVTGSRWR